MSLTIEKCNPFVRAAELQPAVLEGESLRMAYDCRLFAVLEGGGTLLLESCNHAIQKGTVIFLPPACGYCFRGRIRVAVLNFDMTRACDDRKSPFCPPPVSHFERELLFDTTLVRGFEQPIIDDSCDIVLPSVTEIVTAYKNRDSYSDALTSAKLKCVLADILRQRDTDIRPEQRLAAKVQGFVRMYASEIGSNEDVANHFGYHPVYIASVFKNETGNTLHGAIIEQRISDACRWLLQTNLPIEEIAHNTGFSSRSHFCTVFKKHTGLTPGSWRNKNGGAI